MENSGSYTDVLLFTSTSVSTRAEQSKFLQLDREYLLRTTGQAASLFGTSSSSLRRWIHEGKLPAVRMGKLHYVVEEFPWMAACRRFMQMNHWSKRVVKMRRDEKSLLKRLAHPEKKLALLGEPQNATQRRLKTLWQYRLNPIERIFLVFSGQDRRAFTLLVKRKIKEWASTWTSPAMVRAECQGILFSHFSSGRYSGCRRGRYG